MRYLKSIISGILIIISVSCSLNDLSLPVWDTNLRVHFNRDQISMSEVLKEESLKDSLNANIGDTLIYVSINDTTEPKTIEQSDLAFKPDDDQFVEEIGDIELDDPDPKITRPRILSQMLPITIGQQLIIPDTTVVPDTNSVSFDSYQSVSIHEADMFIIFFNNLTMDIESGMVISVYDNDLSKWVGDFVFTESIPSGSNLQSSFVPLDGQQLTNNFIFQYSIPIKGTNGQPYEITQADVESNFTMEFHITDMDVKHVVGEVPEQTEKENDASAFDSEDKEVISAQIKSGVVNLIITNNVAVSADVKIRILSIVDEDNQPLTKTKRVYADSVIQFPIDLSDYKIINYPNAGTNIPLDSIHYEVTVTSIPTEDNEYVEIASTDEIVVDLLADSIFVSTFTGTIDNMTIDIDPVEEEDLVDLSDLDGTFRLPDLNLIFTFYNEIDFDINLDLEITGEKVENGNVTEAVTLNVPVTLNRGQTGNPEETIVILDDESGSPSIVDLMAIFPTRITVKGNGYVNGLGNVTLGDKLWARYSIESPLKILIEEALVIAMDLDSLTSKDLDEDARQAIADDLNDVTINLDIKNGLPFGTNILFVLALDSTNMFTQPDDSNRIILESTIDKGQVNENTGLVQTPTQTIVPFAISKEELQIFKRKDNSDNYLPVYYRSQVTIDSSQVPIQFRKSDELSYSGFIEVKYEVDIK